MTMLSQEEKDSSTTDFFKAEIALLFTADKYRRNL
jgi:hypothetical protein